jgi:hypothetical protein
MFRKSTIAVCAGLAASALLLGAPQVAAARADDPSRVVLRDGTGDVWRVNVRTSAWTHVGDLPPADVRRAVVTHRSGAVVVRSKFENLRRIGRQSYWTGLATPDSSFFAEVVSRPGARAGRHELVDGSTYAEVACAGLSHRIDYATETVTLRVPRTCLGSPRWVSANLGNILVVGERPHRRHYADNPHNRQPYSNTGTRRIYPAG